IEVDLTLREASIDTILEEEDKQAKVLLVIEFLKQNLELKLIPNFAFQLMFFPSPNWELFEDDDIPISGWNVPMSKDELIQTNDNIQE
ncbi:24166_t:CDS:2, partial [Gigaspora margarita]